MSVSITDSERNASISEQIIEHDEWWDPTRGTGQMVYWIRHIVTEMASKLHILERRTDTDVIEACEIPVDHLWFSKQDGFTVISNPETSCYIKRQSLIGYNGAFTVKRQARHLLLHEALICEILKRKPHPNIAAYLGCCVIDPGWVTGLCFEKYGETLSSRLTSGNTLGRAACLKGIASGIEHLHSLRIIHNNINPTNIMLDSKDRPIIIGFDCWQWDGDKLGLKRGKTGWTDENAERAIPENDFYGLRKIEALLREPGDRRRGSTGSILLDRNHRPVIVRFTPREWEGFQRYLQQRRSREMYGDLPRWLVL
ncbi:hypothetical protein MMC28_000355 [Mycoblastus sanguinarius]|nr:hypothetical protein [Mycoblastus sanguinarius]